MRRGRTTRRVLGGLLAIATSAVLGLPFASPATADPALSPADDSSLAPPSTTSPAGPSSSPDSAGSPRSSTTDSPDSPSQSGSASADVPSVHPTAALCPSAEPGSVTCLSVVRTDLVGPNSTGDQPDGYGPADLRDAYDLPSKTAGIGRTVAVVAAFDHPTIEADLAVYRSEFGLPPCTTDNGCLRKVDQRGGTDYPRADSGWAGEIALDTQMVSAICPNCSILLVEADDASFGNLAAAVDRAVSLGAEYVSNSYGTRNGEERDQTEFDSHYDHPGVGITVSSGDDEFVTEWPASNPRVTAVGGTTLRPADTARGWTESAWSGAGSGCSELEPKPDFQTDTGCGTRTVADVAAVADPATGVAVYDSFQSPGWRVFGGTSVGAPIIAATYALAGPPTAGEYPNEYPYQTPALHDVITGRNGLCDGSYLCTAGVGYDGPTGLGTPDGVAAFRPPGVYGELTGVVTDSADGTPVAGARLSTADRTVVADAGGHVRLPVPVGQYTVTVSAFGYGSTTADVTVPAGGVTRDFALVRQVTATISGTVRDGSGQNWPLHAQITVSGRAGDPVWSDPVTGHYEVEVPAGDTYDLRVTPEIPGYQTTTLTVPVGADAVTQDIAVPVDSESCAAPGYAVRFGPTQTFDEAVGPAGWTVVDRIGDGGVWTFDDPGDRGNLTGGDGGFAIVDSDHLGASAAQDTDLISPRLDLSGTLGPRLSFQTNYRPFINHSTADVDYSVDGGHTWVTAWHQDTSFVVASHETVPLPGAAGQPNVRIRFHYTGVFAWWWQLDDIAVGTCAPIGGGLVTGHVTSTATGAPVNGATVSGPEVNHPGRVTTASPDPAVGEGAYWLFSTATGSRSFTASSAGYRSDTRQVTVVPGQVASADFTLDSGHLTVSTDAISAHLTMDQVTAVPVLVTNDGGVPVHLSARERFGGPPVLASTGSPTSRVSAPVSDRPTLDGSAGSPPPEPGPADRPWTPVADYPVAMMDATVVTGTDGRVYSFGGTRDGRGAERAAFVYDPGTMVWTRIADLPHARQKAAAAAFDGRIYVTSGWGEGGEPVAATDVYDPRTDSWSSGPDIPTPLGASGFAQEGRTLYVVGGCADECGRVEVFGYDLTDGTWSRLADYPEPIGWESCGGIGGALYCAGGENSQGVSDRGYRYDPVLDRWSAIAAMPEGLWASAYTAANGMLVISGGVVGADDVLTNEGFGYDPDTDTWASIPNADRARYRSAGTCGFYAVGGSIGGFDARHSVTLLPGLDQCGGTANVGWLAADPSDVTVNPGDTVTLTVTLTARGPTTNQPGTYSARLDLVTDSPTATTPITVSMTVAAPPTWGKIEGQVTGVGCDGSRTPLSGATIAVDSTAASVTLRTDADGRYELWLDSRLNPLTLIAAKNGWRPVFTSIEVQPGETSTVNLTLSTGRDCP